MSGWWLPVLLCCLGLVVSGFWFGVHRRRAAEMQGGIQALANMKWRECVGLLIESLAEDGYREAPFSRQPGDGGTEFLLMHGDSKVLLGYKHGTAYRLGEANVRDFANGVRLQGADRGMLVTLGSTDGAARRVARMHQVELIDGSSLWPRIRGFMPAALLAGVRHQAAVQVSRGLWLGAAASVLLGVVALFGENVLPPSVPAASPTPAVPTPAAADDARAGATPAASADPTLNQIEATAQALAAVDKLTDSERAGRRADAAKSVAGIPQVTSAVWSTQSTLVLGLASTDGKDEALIAEACRTLTRYEELRFTRLQLEPPAGSDRPVRWRQCQ